MAADLISIYRRKVGDGKLRHDIAQLEAAGALEEIRLFLESRDGRKRPWRFPIGKRARPSPEPGLYLWGDVGSGKSMLMDLFFAATRIGRKRRVHFHAFMQEVHDGLNAARGNGAADAIQAVAANIARDARLLCFDELQIGDIADAMIVGRLFECLFGAGVSVVATSNRAPGELYKDGLNRALFEPFIDLIGERMIVHRLLGELDYRRAMVGRERTWFSPLGPAATEALDRIWDAVTGGARNGRTLAVNGREVRLPRYWNGAARAGFDDLCGAPLGPADYLAIADAAHLVVLDDVPRLSRENNNEAKRFVTLVDTLYEARVSLVSSAETEPEGIYEDGPGAFEFRRTASRLREMQSADWGRDRR